MPRVMSVPKLTNRRNSRQTWRGFTGIGAAPWCSVTRHPLSFTSQSTNAPTASGSEASMAMPEIFRLPYGSGTGKATRDGWPGRSSRDFASGT